ncbi:hypothetical protein JL721_11145 [Aureococcus anophagefferens]|nr:hypothetical protein JL721_11145 [Aureococcus anophagefferens]
MDSDLKEYLSKRVAKKPTAKKPAAKKPAAKKPAVKQPQKGDATRITLKQKNPKQLGCKSHQRYEKYKAATTKGEFRKLGGSSADYTHDLKHKFITEL